jgi:hypothetical protein
LILKKVETDRGYENLNRYRLLLFFLVGCKLRLAFKAFSKKKKKRFSRDFAHLPLSLFPSFPIFSGKKQKRRLGGAA